jgi:hypothetical protein
MFFLPSIYHLVPFVIAMTEGRNRSLLLIWADIGYGSNFVIIVDGARCYIIVLFKPSSFLTVPHRHPLISIDLFI